MSILSNPKSLYILRLIQLAFAIGVLVTVSYAGTHKGWWSNIQGGIAVGGMIGIPTVLLKQTCSLTAPVLVIAFLFTLLLSIHTIITHHRNSNPFSATGKFYTILRVLFEVLALLLWIAAAGLMLRPKAGCEETASKDGVTACYGPKGGDPRGLIGDKPTITWSLGIAFSFVEV